MSSRNSIKPFRLSRRPLPDERPRQSVANLIGRFEQQSKRQSIGSAPPLLAKQLTGASNASAGELNHKEANKEKRLLKLISPVVVKCMSKHKDQMDHDQFKKYAKEVQFFACRHFCETCADKTPS